MGSAVAPLLTWAALCLGVAAAWCLAVEAARLARRTPEERGIDALLHAATRPRRRIYRGGADEPRRTYAPPSHAE